MIIGIPKENVVSERRVAATPQSTKRLIKLGYSVHVQSEAGTRASFPDELYVQAGATIVKDANEIWSNSDVIVKVDPPDKSETKSVAEGTRLISFVWPAKNAGLLKDLESKSVTTLAMDCVPRISRAQKMDALSSMANIAGYRAIIEAAGEFGSFFTGQITAAGKVPPAKVLVIGAGVAGLSAIGTANSLGAVVRAFDTRLAVKDQVKSMGGEFLELEFEESGEGEGGYAKTMSDEFIAAEMELFGEQAKEVDIIVTTALIPGKPAPRLITAEMVKSMKAGSVIVDMAAESGGNCELTKPGKKIVKHGVTIIGYGDLPSRLPTQSSTLYANNITNLISDMTPEKDGQMVIDLEDQVVRGALVTHQGNVMWPPPKIADASPPATTVQDPKPAEAAAPQAAKPVIQIGDLAFDSSAVINMAIAAISILFLLAIGWNIPGSSGFVSHLTVFVLACFVGYQVIWNVNPALHTPLMSVTNAISGILIIGGMIQIVPSVSFTSFLAGALAVFAVLIATINIAGGFFVTNRMLAMFRRRD